MRRTLYFYVAELVYFYREVDAGVLVLVQRKLLDDEVISELQLKVASLRNFDGQISGARDPHAVFQNRRAVQCYLVLPPVFVLELELVLRAQQVRHDCPLCQYFVWV